MNGTRSVEELERDLRCGSDVSLPAEVLADIRTRGSRRRRVRWTACIAGAATVVAVASLGYGLTDPGPRAEDTSYVDQPAAPKELSPLARRALAEIPGAVKVSDWQVVIPGPESELSSMDEAIPARLIDAGPIDVGARRYTGVTMFARSAFPAWLYDGVLEIERSEVGDEDGTAVGSTATGIIVDAGPLDLGCMRPLPDWGGGEEMPGDTCFPAMMGLVGGSRTYEWGMGAVGFLEPGQDLQLFSTDDYGSDGPQTVWIGGTHGTEVATVDLVSTDGTQVAATVTAGTLVPGDTMFWGTVSGELAVAITRDADGDVLERHELEPCSDPVDCEVR
jgi:hypothetical protein